MVTPIIWIDVKGSVWRRLPRQPLFRCPLPGDGLLEDGGLLNVREALSWWCHKVHPLGHSQGGLDATRLTRGHWDFRALRLKWWPLEICELTIEQSVLRHRSNVSSTPWPCRRRGKLFAPSSTFPKIFYLFTTYDSFSSASPNNERSSSSSIKLSFSCLRT